MDYSKTAFELMTSAAFDAEIISFFVLLPLKMSQTFSIRASPAVGEFKSRKMARTFSIRASPAVGAFKSRKMLQAFSIRASPTGGAPQIL